MSANIIIVMFEVNIKNNGTTNKIVPFVSWQILIAVTRAETNPAISVSKINVYYPTHKLINIFS